MLSRWSIKLNQVIRVALSAAEIVTALYFREMNIDPQNPKLGGLGRFVLSKGHACPIQYAALAKRGTSDESELSTLRKRVLFCKDTLI